MPTYRFKSYLSDRHQFVAVNEDVSNQSQVQYEVTFHALHVTLWRYHQETRGELLLLC